MADAPQIPDEAEVRARWGAFAWTKENAEQAKTVIARYPAGRQRSAVMPLLDLAQRQVGAERDAALAAADVVQAVHHLDAFDVLGHLVAELAFQPQAQLASASDLAGVARLPLDGRCSF